MNDAPTIADFAYNDAQQAQSEVKKLKELIKHLEIRIQKLEQNKV
jgi:hypothetical protein